MKNLTKMGRVFFFSVVGEKRIVLNGGSLSLRPSVRPSDCLPPLMAELELFPLTIAAAAAAAAAGLMWSGRSASASLSPSGEEDIHTEQIRSRGRED